VFIGRNQLNVVLEPIIRQKIFSGISGRNVSWLFVFNFNQNLSNSFLLSLIENYFLSFDKITFNSKIHILGYQEEMAYLFEVFRKMPDTNVKVSHLCSFNQTSNEVVYLNDNDVLVRRKDLTGVHFRIGYIPNESFFYEENEAC
jgi:hypothetical protein